MESVELLDKVTRCTFCIFGIFKKLNDKFGLLNGPARFVFIIRVQKCFCSHACTCTLIYFAAVIIQWILHSVTIILMLYKRNQA